MSLIFKSDIEIFIKQSDYLVWIWYEYQKSIALVSNASLKWVFHFLSQYMDEHNELKMIQGRAQLYD